MSLTAYTGYLGVTVLAILFVLRGCYFLFVVHSDPLKAVVPRIKKFEWPKTVKEKKQEQIDLTSNS